MAQGPLGDAREPARPPAGPSRGRKVFCFLRRGPGLSKVAGGKVLTERSKTLGPARAACGGDTTRQMTCNWRKELRAANYSVITLYLPMTNYSFQFTYKPSDRRKSRTTCAPYPYSCTGPPCHIPRTFGAWALDLENQISRQRVDGIQILLRFRVHLSEYYNFGRIEPGRHGCFIGLENGHLRPPTIIFSRCAALVKDAPYGARGNLH